jgi:hypothetical protein
LSNFADIIVRGFASRVANVKIALQEENRQPSKFGESVEMESFEYVAPHANFLYKTIFGNMWLFRGIVSSILSGDPATDAIQRTTTVRPTATLIPTVTLTTCSRCNYTQRNNCCV